MRARSIGVSAVVRQLFGDGVAEYVPYSDLAGPAPPQHAYTLFMPTDHGREPQPQTGFYVGGNLYRDWASVPDSYKVVDPNYPDPRRSMASIFTFKW